MYVNRSGKETILLMGVLALLAVFYNRSEPVYAASGLGAWFVAHQVQFAREIRRIDSELQITVSPARESVAVGEEVEVVVTAQVSNAASIPITIEANPPVASRIVESSTLRLGPGETRAQSVIVYDFRVSGTYQLEPLMVTLQSRRGLFSESLPRGEQPEIEVSPGEPTNLHIGQSGDATMETHGDGSNRSGRQGVEPDRIREYLPGDPARNIDWLTTARLGELHTKQFGMETQQHSIVVLDNSATMGVGLDGERKFDYAKLAAVEYIQRVSRTIDSFLIYAIDETSVVSRERIEATRLTTDSLRKRLSALPEPTGRTANRSRRTVSFARPDSSLVDSFSGNTTTFAEKLRPFLNTSGLSDARSENPIRTVVQAERAKVSDSELAVAIFTDDTRPKRVWEGVMYARAQNFRVLVFLTPHVLFETGGLGDMESAYNEYQRFESFRRRLDDLSLVTAYEVAPGDRLTAVASAQPTVEQ